MKKKKTIIIDLECLFRDPSKPFDSKNIPLPKADLSNFLAPLSQHYTIWIYSRTLLGLAGRWCEKYNLDKFLKGVIGSRRSCYMYISSKIHTPVDEFDILNHLDEIF